MVGWVTRDKRMVHTSFPEGTAILGLANWQHPGRVVCLSLCPLGVLLETWNLRIRQYILLPFFSRSEPYLGTLVSQLKSWRTSTWCLR